MRGQKGVLGWDSHFRLYPHSLDGDLCGVHFMTENYFAFDFFFMCREPKCYVFNLLYPYLTVTPFAQIPPFHLRWLVIFHCQRNRIYNDSASSASCSYTSKSCKERVECVGGWMVDEKDLMRLYCRSG